MYHYKECGLNNVFLKNGYEIEDDQEYGDLFSVMDIEGLHRAIGCEIAKAPRALTGSEIKFLRKELDLSQKRVASMLGVKELTVGRWERDETAMSRGNELLLRAYYLEVQCGDGQLKDLIEELAKMDTQARMTRLEMEDNDSRGWTAMAA